MKGSKKRRMTLEEAEFLAEGVIQQFSEIPLGIPAIERVKLDKKELVKMILKAKPIFGSSRMQFRVRGKEELNTFYKYGNNGYPLQKFCVQRVLTRDDSGIEERPSPGLKDFLLHPYEAQKIKMRDWTEKKRRDEEVDYDDRKGWYPQVICRRFRHEIQPEIRKNIAGLWGLGGTYEIILPISEDEEIPGYAKTFLILFPGLTKIEREIIARFSTKHQRPQHIEIPYVEHDILEERLYTCPLLNKYKNRS